MEEHSEECQEQVFEIVWHQYDRGDWTAEVTDIRTDERRQVCSWEELQQFIQIQLGIACSPTTETSGS